MPERSEITLVKEKLFEDRILFLGEVNEVSSLLLNMKMLYLESLDPKGDIFLYINSPGGNVSAGLSIYDTMNFISCDVWTVCMGTAASMGAFLLAGGTRGKRIAMPNAKIMIHQPLLNFGSSRFQATELKIMTNEIMRTREQLNKIMAANTDQPYDRIDSDTERDFWMTADEALEYGIIDSIAKKREDISRIIKKLKEGRIGGE